MPASNGQRAYSKGFKTTWLLPQPSNTGIGVLEASSSPTLATVAPIATNNEPTTVARPSTPQPEIQIPTEAEQPRDSLDAPGALSDASSPSANSVAGTETVDGGEGSSTTYRRPLRSRYRKLFPSSWKTKEDASKPTPPASQSGHEMRAGGSAKMRSMKPKIKQAHTTQQDLESVESASTTQSKAIFPTEYPINPRITSTTFHKIMYYQSSESPDGYGDLPARGPQISSSYSQTNSP